MVLKVTSEVTDEMHLHGYDLSKDLVPGQEAVLEFTADQVGKFELELHRFKVNLGDIEVY